MALARTPRGRQARAVATDRYENSLKAWLARMARDFRRRGGQAVPTLTEDEWCALLEHYRGACAYCGRLVKTGVPIGDPDGIVLDHVIPIERGGGHHKDNVVPACWRCNARKGQAIWTPLKLSRPPAVPTPGRPAKLAGRKLGN